MTLRFLLALAAVVLFVPACGSSSSTGGPGSGTLAIQNEPTSPGVVDEITVTEQFGLLRSFEFDVTLAPGQTHTVNELLPGVYSVEIRWEDAHVDTHPNQVVKQNETTDLDVSR